MIIHNCNYELTAVKPEQYPTTQLPEIAFAGRSNVGKSSIINSLANRKRIARVGARPGMTRQINFYNNDEKFYFVDLPGYGYASVSKSEKTWWGEIIDTYLSTRITLKLVVLLVDIRHEPSKEDKLMHEWLVHHQVPYIVVATKSDKVSRSQMNLRLKDITKSLNIISPARLLSYSSENKQGKDELLDIIEEYIK